MATQITEAYDLCPQLGAITINASCVADPKAIIHRSGLEHEYKIEAPLASTAGMSHTFEIPADVFSFPIGFYDLKIFDGKLHKKTVRLNLHTTGMSLPSTLVESNCPDKRAVAPNTELVVSCLCVEHGVNSCCPEECDDATLIVIDDHCDEDAPILNVDLLELLNLRKERGKTATLSTTSGGPNDLNTTRISVGGRREVIRDMTVKHNIEAYREAVLIERKINPMRSQEYDEIQERKNLADAINEDFKKALGLSIKEHKK